MPSLRYTILELLKAPEEEILGRLAAHYTRIGFATLWSSAIQAWSKQLSILKEAGRELLARYPQAQAWSVLLEYLIPLRDRRPDVVILANTLIFVVEFKVGAVNFHSSDLWQSQSYALDLRDFHPACAGKTIVPILVATSNANQEFSERALVNKLRGHSFPVQKCNALTLGPCLCEYAAMNDANDTNPIDPAAWEAAVYNPTPTIIQAAQSLFRGHHVREISHAFSDSLDKTSTAIVRAIQHSRSKQCRTLCFVTGIPGSGKTLVGLNAVHDPALLEDNRSSAVFLSGNGPLVKVIREALSREQAARGIRMDEARQVASSFIANVHGFLKTFAVNGKDSIPRQNAIIFDEAQRAWNAEAVSKEHGLNLSEPAMLLEVMERVQGWATIIALVGGGQEINTGEGGLAEWGKALESCIQKWRVLASPEVITASAPVAGQVLFPAGVPETLDLVEAPELHLSVNVRSHRAKLMGDWVNQFLTQTAAEASLAPLSDEYPVFLTRCLSKARNWLMERQEPTNQRTGLLASSGAARLRAFGLEVSSPFRKGISYPDWFLNPLGDVRSSYQLEIAATEFECQGLEIDWAGVCWGGDFVINHESGSWAWWQFVGNQWRTVQNATKRQYITNKYRVLMTRARRGMVIWVPAGRAAAINGLSFDATAQRLIEFGIPCLD